MIYFRSDTKYTRVVTPRREAFIRTSLTNLARMLDPSNFCQVHRSVIVNLNAVTAVHHAARGRLELQLRDRDEVLPVSADYAHLFRHM